MHPSEIPDLDTRGLRNFGLTTGAIVAVLFGVLFPWFFGFAWPIWPWAVLGILALWALAAPNSLAPVYRGWMRVGLLLGKITTPIIMSLVFLVAILPGAIVLKLLKKDPMRRSRESVASYRVPSKTTSKDSLEKPY